MEALQKMANRLARRAHCARADYIKFDPSLDLGDGVEFQFRVEHVRYGYRKHTTGQYVPTAYRSKFGWKNTYYQPAKTTVVLPAEFALMTI